MGHDFARVRVDRGEPVVSGGGPAPIQRKVEQKGNGKWHDTDYPDREFDSEAEAREHSSNQMRIETPHTSTSFDVPSLLRSSMEDVDAMAQNVPSASGFGHLNQSVGDTGRRGALIESPEDRARLAQQARQDGGFYAQLFRSGTSGSQIGTGRMQSPPFNRTETHVYGPDGGFAPYPTASTEVSSMAREHGVPTQQIFGDLLRTFQGMPPVTPLSQGQQGQLHNTSNIVGIAEAHRDPFMSAMSTASISNASHDSSITPTELFGRKEKKGSKTTNRQGLLTASGTGAKSSFNAVRRSLASGSGSERDIERAVGQIMREKAARSKNKKKAGKGESDALKSDAMERMRNMHRVTRDHLARTGRIESEKVKRGFRPFAKDPQMERDALDMRLKSSFRRDLMLPTGLMGKNLRSLSDPSIGRGPRGGYGPTASEEEMDDWFAEAQERDEQEDQDLSSYELDEDEPNMLKKLHREDEDDATGGGTGLAQPVS